MHVVVRVVVVYVCVCRVWREGKEEPTAVSVLSPVRSKRTPATIEVGARCVEDCSSACLHPLFGAGRAFPCGGSRYLSPTCRFPTNAAAVQV